MPSRRLRDMLLLDLPRTEYQEALDIQHAVVDRKIAVGGPDVLILLEHPPTVTLGVRGRAGDLLLPEEELAIRGVAVYRTDRGGQATYHGPGQLVAYPVMDLKSRRLSAKDYVGLLEETILRTLARFGVAGFRMAGKPGVWTGPTQKIASIGVKIHRRVTFHGFSLNVNVPVDPGELIVSCGESDIVLVSIGDLIDRPVSLEEAKAAVKESFSEVFDVQFEIDPPDGTMKSS